MQQAACVVPCAPLAPLGLVLDVCYSEMIVVGPYVTLGIDHRRNIVAPGTTDIFRTALGSHHA